MLRFLLLCAVLAWWAMPLQAGGGKAAYQNYFLGSYYFAEGDYSRAVTYLRRAYEAEPEEYNFILALSLALGRTDKYQEGILLLDSGDNLLKSTHPEYNQLLAMRHFVAGLIFCFGKQYQQAIPSITMAIKLQRELDKPETLGAMLNALGYAKLLDQGRGAESHNGLAAHHHIHLRDIERSRDIFHQALLADPHQQAATYNYKFLCDTTGVEPAVPLLQAVNRKPGDNVVSARYSSLPVNMSGVLQFRDYDEIVFLLDISGSMVMEKVACVGRDRFQVMRETALYLLDSIDAQTQVGIGTIGGDCGTTPRLWHQTTAIPRPELKSALEFLVPDGTTPLLTILQQTPQLFSDNPNTTKSIFFISDGENICRMPGVDICEWSESLAQQGITINILTFLSASLDNTGAFAEYTCLAENTRGRILYLDVDRCSLQRYTFDLVAACQLYLPDMQRVNCWGPSVKSLWAIFPEKD